MKALVIGFLLLAAGFCAAGERVEAATAHGGVPSGPNVRVKRTCGHPAGCSLVRRADRHSQQLSTKDTFE